MTAIFEKKSKTPQKIKGWVHLRLKSLSLEVEKRHTVSENPSGGPVHVYETKIHSPRQASNRRRSAWEARILTTGSVNKLC